jgi:hypothetical protein
MGIPLYDYQKDAIKKMKNGCILCGGVGSGKSRTAIAYYYLQEGGEIDADEYIPMSDPPRDLYIITTARKRDQHEWEGDLSPFLISTDPSVNLYNHNVVIDSWNNISKYSDVVGAFFIFDEQRVVGNGTWVKSFLKIAKVNKWILLSATPGDTWMDYVPVFLANGFYKNRTEFTREHVVYRRFSKFPQVDRYLGTGRLIRQRNSLLVDMDFKRQTNSHHEDVYVKYDISLYKDTMKNRRNPYSVGYIPCKGTDEGALLIGKDIALSEVTPIMKGWMYKPKDGEYVRLVCEPIENASRLCYILRKIVNSDDSRIVALMEILEKRPRAIIFYNFDYELELLKNLYYGEDVQVAEWNGHKHEPVPNSDKWVYLVQYTSGAEGWNCIKTDTIIFFSQNYSYKIMEQSAGRIDRLNTPYSDLYYYHLKTRSGIDLAISKALNDKKKFNASRFVKW